MIRNYRHNGNTQEYHLYITMHKILGDWLLQLQLIRNVQRMTEYATIIPR